MWWHAFAVLADRIRCAVIRADAKALGVAVQVRFAAFCTAELPALLRPVAWFIWLTVGVIPAAVLADAVAAAVLTLPAFS